MHDRSVPSGFGTKRIGPAAGDVDLTIFPLANILSRYFLSTLSSDSDNGYMGPNGGVVPGSNSILWSYLLCSGSACIFSSLKISA